MVGFGRFLAGFWGAGLDGSGLRCGSASSRIGRPGWGKRVVVSIWFFVGWRCGLGGGRWGGGFIEGGGRGGVCRYV